MKYTIVIEAKEVPNLNINQSVLFNSDKGLIFGGRVQGVMHSDAFQVLEEVNEANKEIKNLAQFLEKQAF